MTLSEAKAFKEESNTNVNSIGCEAMDRHRKRLGLGVVDYERRCQEADKVIEQAEKRT